MIEALAVGTRLALATGVPSFLHEILADLFRTRPLLGPELLGACAGIDYAQVPRLPDAAAARAAPQLAVLAAMAHPELETAKTAEAGIAELPEDQQKLYWDVIWSGLPEHVRRLLEARMIKGYEYQSDFARKYVAQGREEGREEGLRRAIVELVCARFPGLRDELEGQLRGQPEARLVQLAAELGKAQDEDAVRATLGPRS